MLTTRAPDSDELHSRAMHAGESRSPFSRWVESELDLLLTS